MEIVSHSVDTDDLGSLHFTRFTPPNASTADLGLHFGGVNSRIDTIDTFGVAYILATERNMIVDVVDRPGNGRSTLPESTSLHADYMRHGFVAVQESIMEAQSRDEVYQKAKRLHASGMSLGGQVAVQYLNGVGERASSATLMDSAGMRLKASRIEAVSRYFFYLLVVEPLAGKVAGKPSVEDVFSQENDLIDSHANFMEVYSRLSHTPKQKDAGKAEFRELCRLADGTGPDLAVSLLQAAVDENRSFELRASRSGARIISDNRSVDFINKTFDDFDRVNPGMNRPNAPVRYGFSQDGPWWHSLAIAPDAVRNLINPPINQLQDRLK